LDDAGIHDNVDTGEFSLQGLGFSDLRTYIVTWKCGSNGVCYDPGDGSGDIDQANCNKNCASAAPSWNCVQGVCLDPGNGTGYFSDLGNCGALCGAQAQTWDCDATLGCYDPGTGQGNYTDFNTCQNACPAYGCMDQTAFNYDPAAMIEFIPSNCIPCVYGCMDNTFGNYDPLATCSDLINYPCCNLGCTDPTACNYDALATCDDGSCYGLIGCDDPNACNYVPGATCPDPSNPCKTAYGCTFPPAINYDPAATCDDGSCLAVVNGCTDPLALNYYAGANNDDGSCVYVAGCMDPIASNYDPLADIDDSSCTYTCGTGGTTNIPDDDFEHVLEYYANNLSTGANLQGPQTLGWNSAGTWIGNQGTMLGTCGNGIDGDACVTTANIDEIRKFVLPGNTLINFITLAPINISDFTGIEDFTALRNLDISKNNITSGHIDLTQNIHLKHLNAFLCGLSSSNYATRLNLASQYQLTTVHIDRNNLGFVDIRNGNNQNLIFSAILNGPMRLYVDDIALAQAKIASGDWTFSGMTGQFPPSCCWNTTSLPNSSTHGSGAVTLVI
jgi:hypothetical protein